MPLSRPGTRVAARTAATGSLIRLCVFSSELQVAVLAANPDASLDREMSLELIRYLVPDVFRGALLDSLSGHALSAAALAASFTPEGNEGAQLTVPVAFICSVIKAQQPGWSLTPEEA